MSQLTRTSSAGMSLDDALTLDEIAERVAADDFSFLQPLELGIGDLVKVELSDEQVEDVRNGRFISLMSEEAELAGFYKEKLVAIWKSEKQPISLARSSFNIRSRNVKRLLLFCNMKCALACYNNFIKPHKRTATAQLLSFCFAFSDFDKRSD